MARFSRASRGSGEPVKQVRLKLRSIDLMSAVKVGFFVSVAGAIAAIFGTLIIWLILTASGLLNSAGALITSILGGESGVNIEQQFGLLPVMTTVSTLSILNIVLSTALTTVLAALFNLIAKLVGGIAITFTNN
ncbi:MAG: hypothetical protein RIQ37_16 [Actinomycetota bacterium]